MENFSDCRGCNGVGTRDPLVPGDPILGKRSHCYSCGGKGQFPAVDEQDIRNRILASRGKNKGKLKTARPADNSRSIEEKRAYYVWRMARFHGGVDMTMPVMASCDSAYDPYRADLDELSDRIARESFGSDMRAAIRWGRALGAF